MTEVCQPTGELLTARREVIWGSGGSRQEAGLIRWGCDPSPITFFLKEREIETGHPTDKDHGMTRELKTYKAYVVA